MRVLLAAGLVWAGLIASAFAQPREDDGIVVQPPQDNLIVERIAVFYGDLNLSSEAGAAVMLRRLEQGARKVCGGTPGRQPLAVELAYRICREQALSDAVAQLDAPMVNAFYEGRYGRTPRLYASR
jgi:UrcA family protein